MILSFAMWTITGTVVYSTCTTPCNHTVPLINRFGNSITAPVVYVKDLGGGQAEVHIETNFYIEEGFDQPATYFTPGNEAKGKYKVAGRQFTEQQTYIYKGIFTRPTK